MGFHAWRRRTLAAARPLLCWATSLLVLMTAGTGHAALTVELTAGPGLSTLPPETATAMMAGVAAAASKWSALIAESVTLKYTVDYDPMLPALGAAFDVYMDVPYDTGIGGGIKPALLTKASSPFDGVATTKLQPGSTLKLWINDFSPPAAPSFAPHIDPIDSVNNVIMDISRAHMKGLGILPPADGGPGADGTIKFGPAAAAGTFDFDPSNGIDDGTYDFVGVALHEMAHSMGFVSGVDTLATKVPPPIGPPPMPGPDGTPMVTVLDLFRYSSDSVAAAPGAFVPDVSLPVPDVLGFSSARYFSIDGGATPLSLFSTGVALAGDGEQAGHWNKDDMMTALMDPDLGTGFALTTAFETLLMGPLPPDLIALDVIGWTITPPVSVPETSPLWFGSLACGVVGLAYCGRRLLRRRLS